MVVGSSRPRHQLAKALGPVGEPGTFTIRQRAPIDDLDIEIRGLGRLELPLAAAQAKELRMIARQAKYGRGEETLLDRRVRDTWEIPRSRVRIDKRRWNATLLPMVESLGQGLGLPAGRRLTAELHSVLLYERGQFFAPHKDSEKTDGMVASLVVVLPSNATGGELVVEHRGQRIAHPSSRTSLTFIAFYSDVVHEIRPVESGWRMALTYNLILGPDRRPGTASADGRQPVDESRISEISALLDRHFGEPADVPSWLRSRTEAGPPDRLVYLLDHDYTERGLSWSWLKGEDGPRAGLLRAAAERTGCDVALVQADVHETWDCTEEYWGGRTRRWSQGEPVRTDGDAGPPDLDGYELGDLLDSYVSLFDPTDSRGQRMLAAEDHELCATTPSVELAAYESEYEGYTGNAGNTMDRWYLRGAVVVWPRRRAFVVAARTDPASALTELIADHERGAETDESVGERAVDLLGSWPDTVRRMGDKRLLSLTLRVAVLTGDSMTAGGLLDPFDLDDLTPMMAPVLVTLVRRHGEQWLAARLVEWSRPPNVWRSIGDTTASDPVLDWLSALPELCWALIDSEAAADSEPVIAADQRRQTGGLAARHLMAAGWALLAPTIDSVSRQQRPSSRNEALASLGPAVAWILRSTVVVEYLDLRTDVTERVCANRLLAPLAISVVQTAGEEMADPEELVASGVATIAQQCETWLRSSLECPQRGDGDWSIEIPPNWHACDDCETLGAFLSDASAAVLEWPLAKPRRQHIHHVLDNGEFPVRHETRRQGRPYTLVLTKTDDLWEQEAEARRRAQLDLDVVVSVLDCDFGR